jgi:site-specific DNA-methyltransferase (adenine-specific)
MDRVWTDRDLYERYDIDSEQVSFIESLIAERPSNDVPGSDEDGDE